MLYGVLQFHIMMGNTTFFFYLVVQSFDRVGLKQNRFSANNGVNFFICVVNIYFLHLAGWYYAMVKQ